MKEETCMKLISFYYPSTEIKHSVGIVLFYRMVGIYVAEVQTDIAIYGDNYEKITASSDAVIYLQSDDNELSLFDMSEYNDVLVELNRSELQKHTGSQNILYTLDQFIGKHMIDQDEYDDLKAALSVFEIENESYVAATLLGKYYFKQTVQEEREKIYTIYRDVAFGLFDLLKDRNINLWGNEEYIHCRYALIYVLFELNLFCKKNDLDYYVNLDSLLIACEHIDEEDGQYLGNSFKGLQAQIYEQLLENISDAFQLHVLCCGNYYDSYAFFCKGNIMYKKRELSRAIEYFQQSIKIYSQYYRAWFRLGICYKELDIQKNGQMALDAFDKVVNILSNKSNKFVLRALEVEYLFDSYMNIIEIRKRLGEFRDALATCDEALEVYYNVGKSIFYELLNIDLVKKEQIEKDIVSHLDVTQLKKDGIELSMMFDLKVNAMEYLNLEG